MIKLNYRKYIISFFVYALVPQEGTRGAFRVQFGNSRQRAFRFVDHCHDHMLIHGNKMVKSRMLILWIEVIREQCLPEDLENRKNFFGCKYTNVKKLTFLKNCFR